jgi:hypothetical protein
VSYHLTPEFLARRVLSLRAYAAGELRKYRCRVRSRDGDVRFSFQIDRSDTPVGKAHV